MSKKLAVAVGSSIATDDATADDGDDDVRKTDFSTMGELNQHSVGEFCEEVTCLLFMLRYPRPHSMIFKLENSTN